MRAGLALVVLLGGCALTQGPDVSTECTARQGDQVVECNCRKHGGTERKLEYPGGG